MKRQIIFFLLMAIALSSVGQISATATSTDENCGQSNGTVTVTASGNCPTGFTYLWNTSPPQTTVTATNLPAGTYTVTVSCGTETCSATTTVNNLPGPSATVSSTNEICDQANGTATVIATGGTGIYTYLWSDGQITQTAVDLVQGTYTVTVSDGGCSTSETVNVLYSTGSIAGFTAVPDSGSIPLYVNFNDTSLGTVVLWYWSFGDGTYDNGSNITHTYQMIGTFIATLTIIDNNGCSDTVRDTITASAPYAINETSNDNYISILPNPTRDFFSIDFSNLNESDFSIELTDLIGKIVLTKKITAIKMTFDISILPQGFYYLKIYNKQKILNKKILKE